jgi:hypothetical protein
MMRIALVAGAIVTALGMSVVFAQTPGKSWLDMPLSNWNAPGQTLPTAAPGGETAAELRARCSYAPLRTTPGERALADAGWVPFQMFDRQIVDRDVEIIGGLAGADGMCRPADFNVFVFVEGRFAGMLSPVPMSSRTDGSVGGAIRLAGDDTISAGFARYADTDPLCCPSDHVTVRYRIDRKATPPVVVPISVRKTRP